MIGRTLVMGGTVGTLVLAVAMAAPGAARAQASGDAASLPATMKCDPLLARALPGEFDFCLARNRWNQGQHAQAVEFLELAAGWGNKGAQAALGVAYFNGDGVARDRPLGLAWLGLAAERQAPTASGLFASARGKVDAAEFARADMLYQQMRGKYADDVAAARADRRYRREVHALEGEPTYGMGRCIVGFGQVGFSNPNDDTEGAGDKMVSCSQASERFALQILEKRYEVLTEGWNGRVTVGPLQPEKPRARVLP